MLHIYMRNVDRVMCLSAIMYTCLREESYPWLLLYPLSKAVSLVTCLVLKKKI